MVQTFRQETVLVQNLPDCTDAKLRRVNNFLQQTLGLGAAGPGRARTRRVPQARGCIRGVLWVWRIGPPRFRVSSKRVARARFDRYHETATSQTLRRGARTRNRYTPTPSVAWVGLRVSPAPSARAERGGGGRKLTVREALIHGHSLRQSPGSWLPAGGGGLAESNDGSLPEERGAAPFQHGERGGTGASCCGSAQFWRPLWPHAVLQPLRANGGVSSMKSRAVI
ncbi:hypothetical protein FQA47_023363 [Oryzias melastigma]|uniref:Uncharacterized protein n=1 Tax=Oryzias melastigma TaxID=30732 RepID=A0A834C9N3_ORYME|nr:hypothetical protein FQA47_023363 [Oryzias melastigma]